ncbi:hypothetical protein [Caldilinea sp.]|uniref:hypothetical protein n=1 Tax=Caldilinea sp. TaxID=2293560 RepID=UPI0021DF2E7D|nr:hypothetical protein [Caldilinea sp.]GIV69860.1 MAG: hypothetical protein KatS3mg048_2722 [Caldilinea sp.]
MKTRLLLLCILAALLAIVWRLHRPTPPDPRMVALAARATLYALPTPTPQQVVVTQIVVVTQVVTQVVVVTATPTPLERATPSPTATLLPSEAIAAPAAVEAPTPAAAQASNAVEADAPVARAASSFLEAGACPSDSQHQYVAIPVAGGGLEHPPALHADLRLALRGYEPVDAARTLVDKEGPVDGDPPQLSALFARSDAPSFGQTYQVYDWNWGCGEHGCRGALLQTPGVTLAALHAREGEPVFIPSRGRQIYAGGYKALVLYADATHITLGYTREDSVANGYVVHLANLCVDPNLAALYAASDAAGRASLPALREGEPIGVAALGDLLVAVRDRGTFLDPRSRLDWWQGE